CQQGGECASRVGCRGAARSRLFPYTTLFRSDRDLRIEGEAQGEIECQGTLIISPQARVRSAIKAHNVIVNGDYEGDVDCGLMIRDRKSTRLNSSHVKISYAVFCWKKENTAPK